MTRLGLVVHGQPPELVGGTERLVAASAASLAAAGHEVEVFSGAMEWRPEHEVVRDESGPVPVVRVHRSDLFYERWDKLDNPMVERSYRDWLDAYRPELVHVHHWARLCTGLVRVAAEHGVPAVASLHDLFASCPRYHRVRADDVFCETAPGVEACLNCTPRWAFQSDAEISSSLRVFVAELRAEVTAAAALVAPTEGHGRRIMGWLGVDRDVTAIAPAGSSVPAPATRPLADRRARPGDPLRVGTFGHLHPLKGVGVLVDAVARLPARDCVELHVWGEAPDEETHAALRARAEGLPVVWHGAFSPEDLGGAPLDLVVLPTLCAESYSFTLDEATALQVPVLASDLGALQDRATERVRLLPRGDADALAGALYELAGDPDARARMVAAPGPATHDAAAHDAALLAVYEQVLAAPRPVGRPRDDRLLAQREHLFGLRESGLRELLRSEGWEDVVAGLRAEVDRLKGDEQPPG